MYRQHVYLCYSQHPPVEQSDQQGHSCHQQDQSCHQGLYRHQKGHSCLQGRSRHQQDHSWNQLQGLL